MQHVHNLQVNDAVFELKNGQIDGVLRYPLLEVRVYEDIAIKGTILEWEGNDVHIWGPVLRWLWVNGGRYGKRSGMLGRIRLGRYHLRELECTHMRGLRLHGRAENKVSGLQGHA